MSELPGVLEEGRETILDALAEKLAKTDCAAVRGAEAAHPRSILDVLRSCCDQGAGAARLWADTLRRQCEPRDVPLGEVSAYLHCVERVIRYYVVRSVDQKKVLVPTLAQLGDVMEMFRQAVLSGPSAEAIIEEASESDSQALAEVEARKNAILESSLDPIITINHEGAITEFNRAAEQVFGHAREKVLGTRPSEVLFPPAIGAGEKDRIERYLEAGEGSMLGRRVEVTAVRASGETFPAEMAMTISQDHGAPVLSFFIRDLSERKRAELAQVRYAAELERSNAELQQFAYVASHDLQEPLRKIRTFGERLMSKSGEQLDEEGRECVRRMQGAAARMQLLIEGLLSLSRAATCEQHFEPVDLEQVFRDVVADLEVQIEKSEGRVEVGRLPTIQADPVQMRQLFQNLIGNALKFSRPEEPPLVKVQGRFVGRREEGDRRRPAREERCRILVEDNGIGFDPKHGERIFGVFQRLHPRDVYEGTGIGLAICRRIVARHGGTIAARSRPEHGTTFEIVLPVVQPREKQTTGSEP